MDMIREVGPMMEGFSCPNDPYCQRSEYKIREAISSEDQIPDSKNGSTLFFELESTEVQTIVDTYSYGGSSFIGEAGGALGLFLGLSMISIVDFVEYILSVCFRGS